MAITHSLVMDPVNEDKMRNLVSKPNFTFAVIYGAVSKNQNLLLRFITRMNNT